MNRTPSRLKPAATPRHAALQIQLFAALPEHDFECFAHQLERVPLRLGQVLYEPTVPLTHAYFPTTAIVSLHHVMTGGTTT